MKAWDGYHFFGMLIIGVTYALMFAYLFWQKNYFEEKDKKKYDIKVVFGEINKVLETFPGANIMEWNMGTNRAAETKTFTHEGKTKTCISFYGLLSIKKVYTVVIWCVEDGGILRYNARNDPELISNPWKDFEPFGGVDRKSYFPRPYDRRRSYGRDFPTKFDEQTGYDPDQSYLEDFQPQPEKKE